jgi:hypothetical protein
MDKFVRIYGGLGNQIFQYLYGQYLSENTKANVHYYFGVTKSIKAEKRDLELNRIFPGVSIKSNRILLLITKYRAVEYLIRKVRLFRTHFKIVLESEVNAYDINVITEGRLFLGYWQDVIALKKQLEIIKTTDWKSLFKSRLPEEIYNSTVHKSVALHVRRGDYLKLVDVYHEVTIEYYREALGYLRDNNDIGKVFVFSDDISWCKKNLNFHDYEVEFMEKGSIVEDFVAISNCQHKIIANSTFSLLAALLSNNVGQILAPESWAKGDHDIILPKEILRIPNR